MKDHTKRSIESLALSIVALVGLDTREQAAERLGEPTGEPACVRCQASGSTVPPAEDLQPSFTFDRGMWRAHLCKACRLLAFRELQGLVARDWPDDSLERVGDWKDDGAPVRIDDAPERWTEADPACELCAGVGLVPSGHVLDTVPCPRCRPKDAAAVVP